MYLRKAKSDNRGATMVTVLITITFITILGAILLFTSYTGYRVKVAQTVGENKFYDAETAMDEVRAGVQGIVTNHIAVAYTDVLRNYTGDNDLNIEFMVAFKNEVLSDTTLFAASGFDSDGDFPATGSATFNFDTLEEFVSDKASVVLEDINGTRTVDIKGTPVLLNDGSTVFRVDTISIKGLRVTHTTDEGYVSIVESDIMISVPTLHSVSPLSLSEITAFALVASDHLYANNSVVIDGSVYTGSADFNTADVTVTFNSGNFISGGVDRTETDINGDINISAGSKLIAHQEASVWANNIVLGSNIAGYTSRGLTEMKGNTYVAGDLEFRGNRSVAELAGRYFGFGDGTYNAPADEEDTKGFNSSSIIVNSRDNTLRFSAPGETPIEPRLQLRQLHLAGQSFINLSDPNADEIFTGQSMAIKSDQMAYLIPASHLVGIPTNPYIVYPTYVYDDPLEPERPTGMVLNPPDLVSETFYDENGGSGANLFHIDYDSPLWGTTKTLRDYIDPGASGTGGIYTYHTAITGEYNPVLLYVFVKFEDYPDMGLSKQQAASSYFRDYFEASANSSDIEQYLNIYTETYESVDDFTKVSSAGTTFFGTTTDGIGILTRPDTTIVSTYRDSYESLRRTLTRSIPAGLDPADTINYPIDPFDYIVTDEGGRPPHGAYVYDEKVMAYVHDSGSQLLLSSLPLDDLRIIISYGEVIIDAEFRGLILSNNNIRIAYKEVFSGGTSVIQALLAEHEDDGDMISDYLIFDAEPDDDLGDPTEWNLSELVHYDNWKKN